MKKFQARQGDVFIESIESLPSAQHEIVEDGTLARGEMTGHAHRLSGGKYEIMRFVDDGTLGLRVLGDGTLQGGVVLRHEEHAPIAIPDGLYRVTIQREYTPAAIRTVAD